MFVSFFLCLFCLRVSRDAQRFYRTFHPVCVCVCVCVFHTGFLDSEPLREADEDLASEVNLNTSIMTEEEREEIQQELAKVRPHLHAIARTLTKNRKWW